MNTIEKYIHKSLNNKDGKWKSIALQNLTTEMTKEEASQTLQSLKPQLTKLFEDKLNKLKDLNAPDIILTNFEKTYNKVLQNKHPDLRFLVKRMDRE